MPKIDGDFLGRAQGYCDDGLEWCEKRDIEREALVAHARWLIAVAVKEDLGMASYGISMFKLGYEVRRAQLRAENPVECGGKSKPS